MFKKIHHIAVAVGDLDEAAKFYRHGLGLDLVEVEVVSAQKTKVGFFKIGESNIELVQPTEPNSALGKFLETKGQGIHHICFEVDDIKTEIKKLLETGVTMIDQEPIPGAHNSKVAFIHPKSASGVLIELVELSKRK